MPNNNIKIYCIKAMFDVLKQKNFVWRTGNSETPGTSIDPRNGDKAYSDVSVFSRGCQISRGKRHEGEF